MAIITVLNNTNGLINLNQDIATSAPNSANTLAQAIQSGYGYYLSYSSNQLADYNFYKNYYGYTSYGFALDGSFYLNSPNYTAYDYGTISAYGSSVTEVAFVNKNNGTVLQIYGTFGWTGYPSFSSPSSNQTITDFVQTFKISASAYVQDTISGYFQSTSATTYSGTVTSYTEIVYNPNTLLGVGYYISGSIPVSFNISTNAVNVGSGSITTLKEIYANLNNPIGSQITDSVVITGIDSWSVNTPLKNLSLSTGSDTFYITGSKPITANGGSGNDIFYVQSANNIIYGGGGFDTVAFSGVLSNYKVTVNVGNCTVTDLGSTLGTTTIYQASYLQFAGSNYSIAATITGSVANFLSSLDFLGASVYSLSDTSANIASNLDALQTNVAKITSITQSGTPAALAITPTQLANDATTLNKISGNYTLNVSGVVANSVATNYSNSHISSMAVTDTAANISANLATLQADASKISSITVTDGNPISLTADQYSSNSSVMSKLGVPAFSDTTGGGAGYVLPSIYTGPVSSLNYQLIDSTDGAVITASLGTNDFIYLSSTNTSIPKAINGNGGHDVIAGGIGSSFIAGGTGHADTFFLDGRAAGTSWSTITDFSFGSDSLTIWGWNPTDSSLNTIYPVINGATNYTGLTLYMNNLAPDGSSTSYVNSALNMITLSGHTLADLGFNSIAALNTELQTLSTEALNNSGPDVVLPHTAINGHFIVGQTTDNVGTGVHWYLNVH